MDFTLGRWEFQLHGHAAWSSFGVGVEIHLRSWRRAYPWISAGAMLGWFGVQFDAIRPDPVALDMRRDRQRDPQGWLR